MMAIDSMIWLTKNGKIGGYSNLSIYSFANVKNASIWELSKVYHHLKRKKRTSNAAKSTTEIHNFEYSEYGWISFNVTRVCLKIIHLVVYNSLETKFLKSFNIWHNLSYIFIDFSKRLFDNEISKQMKLIIAVWK